MTSDIVNAEVVEVERPARPELWIPVWFDADKGRWCVEYPRLDRGDAEGCHSRRPLLGDFIAHVPAEDAPAAATRGADAEIDGIIYLLNTAKRRYEQGVVHMAKSDIEQAIDRIAALKGA